MAEPERREMPSGRWYEHGVLPITPLVLSRMDGTYDYYTFFRYLLGQGAAYVERVGLERSRKFPLIYLTPESAAFFFKRRTREFDRLVDRIRHGTFSMIARRPFRIYYPETLSREPEAEEMARDHFAETARRNAGIYKIETGYHPSMMFAVTEVNSPMFFGLNAEPFNRRLREHWEENFVSWKPHREL
ncbi:MAG: hypothetical protein HYW25_03625 [Candidatus Aenigmarchaeota archaeon]|nr:hypothetical protein [Candidatus Aenigmarchaeota archaeon]